MSDLINLTVAIPVYLEAENLVFVLPQLTEALKAIEGSEVLIVDTPEPMDNTPEICQQNGVRYLNQEGSTYADAVQTAINNAQGTYLIFMDGDGSHTPEILEEMYSYREDYDIVAGSRYIAQGGSETSRISTLMSRVLNLTYRVVLGLDAYDISNSLKLYRTDRLQKLQLNCRNFDVIEEILVKMNRQKKLKIKEIPFVFKDRVHGTTKRNLVAFIFSYASTLIRLKFGK